MSVGEFVDKLVADGVGVAVGVLIGVWVGVEMVVWVTVFENVLVISAVEVDVLVDDSVGVNVFE